MGMATLLLQCSKLARVTPAGRVVQRQPLGL